MGSKVAAVKTPWGTAWNHAELCRNMNAILASCGVTSATVRRRMTAHAIVASGWAQKIWCYNAWGVKTGKSWTGNYFLADAKEEDASGNPYIIPDDEFRAFSSWSAAVADFRHRISPTSSRYAKAYAALVDEAGDDAEYWRAQGAGGYYTDKPSPHGGEDMTPEKFASICRRVTKETSGQVLEVPGSSFRDGLGVDCNPDCCAARGLRDRCPRSTGHG